MADEPKLPRGATTRQLPSAGDESFVNDGSNYSVHHHVTDMTPVAADAHKAIVKSTHEIPAREMTKRAWVHLAEHYGTLAVVALFIVLALPKLTDPVMIAGLLALVGLTFAILAIIKAIKGGKD